MEVTTLTWVVAVVAVLCRITVDDVIDVIATHPKVCGYIHLPVQSGSNAVLERMRRGYTVEQVERALTCLNDAGIPFSGHTEYLAARTGGHPVMLLACPELRVALATTHLPLRAVADGADHLGVGPIFDARSTRAASSSSRTRSIADASGSSRVTVRIDIIAFLFQIQ